MTAITLADVDFQIRVSISGEPIASDHERALATLPFPNCNPPFFQTDTQIEGFKCFPLGDYRCIARFFNAERTDEYQRPVLSARVLLLPPAVTGYDLTWWFAPISRENSVRALNVLAHQWRDHHPAEQELRSILSRLSLQKEALIQLLSSFLVHGKAAILGLDEHQRHDLLRAIAMLVPPAFLAARSLCTYAFALDGNEEDLACLAKSLEPPAKSWLDLFGKRRKNDETPMVDAEQGFVTGCSSGKKEKFVAHLFQRMLGTEPWPKLENQARFDLFHQLMMMYLQGHRFNAAPLKTELDPEALADGLGVLRKHPPG